MRGRRYRKALRYRFNILSSPPSPFPAPPRLTLEDGRDKIVLASFFGYIIDGLIIFGQNCRFYRILFGIPLFYDQKGYGGVVLPRSRGESLSH